APAGVSVGNVVAGGVFAAVQGNDTRVRVWDLETGKGRVSYPLPNPDGAWDRWRLLALSPGAHGFARAQARHAGPFAAAGGSGRPCVRTARRKPRCSPATKTGSSSGAAAPRSSGSGAQTAAGRSLPRCGSTPPRSGASGLAPTSACY